MLLITDTDTRATVKEIRGERGKGKKKEGKDAESPPPKPQQRQQSETNEVGRKTWRREGAGRRKEEGRTAARPSVRALPSFLLGAHAVASSSSIDSDIHPTWKVKKRALDEEGGRKRQRAIKTRGARPPVARDLVRLSVCLAGLKEDDLLSSPRNPPPPFLLPIDAVI